MDTFSKTTATFPHIHCMVGLSHYSTWPLAQRQRFLKCGALPWGGDWASWLEEMWVILGNLHSKAEAIITPKMS
jgi:hypothetical protein